MTSVPPPPPGWDSEHSSTQPELGETLATTPAATKPKRTALVVTVSVLVGILGIAGASAATFKIVTGSFFPTSQSDTPTPAASPTPDPATPQPEVTNSDTPPQEDPTPQPQSPATFSVKPQKAWEVDGADLLEHAGIAENLSWMEFIAPQTGDLPNNSGTQIVRLNSATAEIIAGINAESGAVRWTHILTRNNQSSAASCFTLDGGELIGCTTARDATGRNLIFFTAATGEIYAQPMWGDDVWFIGGTASDLYLGGSTHNGALYLALGHVGEPGGRWYTETEKGISLAQDLWHRSLTYDDTYVQFTLNDSALVVNAKTGERKRTVVDGFAQIVPGAGPVIMKNNGETELLNVMTAKDSRPWHVIGEATSARPIFGVGDSLYDVTSAKALWKFPENPDATAQSDEIDGVTQLPNLVLRHANLPNEDGMERVTAYDLRTGAELWSKVRPDFGTTMVQDDVAVGLAYRGTIPIAVQALDLNSGNQLWDVPVEPDEAYESGYAVLSGPVHVNSGMLVLRGEKTITGMTLTP